MAQKPVLQRPTPEYSALEEERFRNELSLILEGILRELGRLESADNPNMSLTIRRIVREHSAFIEHRVGFG